MVAYAKRLKRNRVNLSASTVPVGNHLLLSGILVTVNKAVYDIGFPGWMVKRIERVKSIKNSLRKRSQVISNSKAPRYKPLPQRWWNDHSRSLFNEDQNMKNNLENIILRKSKIGKNKKKKGKNARTPGRKPRRKSKNKTVSFTEGGSYEEEHAEEPHQDMNNQSNNENGFSIDSFLTNRRSTNEQFEGNSSEDGYDFSL